MISFTPWSIESVKTPSAVVPKRSAPVRKNPAPLPQASSGKNGPQAAKPVAPAAPPAQQAPAPAPAPQPAPAPSPSPEEQRAVLARQAARQRYLDNVYLLAKLIYGEARGEPYTGQVAVGAVVMNRITSPIFPNTLSGVVYQPGAFDAVVDGQINLSPDQEAINAARDAIGGWDPTGGCIYYYNPVKTTNSWIWSRPVVLVIGDHHFAR